MSVRESIRSLPGRLEKKFSKKREASSLIYEDVDGVRAHRSSDDTKTDTNERSLTTGIPDGSILVVGSVNMDYISLVRSHAELNRHVLAKSLIKMPGGHGLNQAIACIRMSHYRPDEPLAPDRPLTPHDIDLSVKIVAMVGESGGQEQTIRNKLRSHGIDITHLGRVDDDTGSAHISVDPFGHSKVESYPGANSYLRPENIPDFHPPPDLVLVQLEIPVDTAQRVVEMARAQNPPVPVIFNPAPDSVEVPEDLWEVDHVIMNAGRADVHCEGRKERKLGPGKAAQNMGAGSRSPEEYWEDCEHFHELGARCVVITLGQNGAIASVREKARKNRPRKMYSGALVAPSPSKTRDTTGASDAFIGAYAVEILRQMKCHEEEDISRAMEMGIKAGGLTISDIGSMESIPWRLDVLETDFDGVDNSGE
ncbi:Ribokinase-like protein [Podospora aff. communis PSN243]|uniref:Ribokinase-like protein n=1 Tax=Podospora aff. communis PSN243 TaxID=3040156 RepID=A0AAV9G7A4_9PEZI|nr:Ribokinase-like protein [Podospora aff. communis PSN243]